jgi:hypothetical protein
MGMGSRMRLGWLSQSIPTRTLAISLGIAARHQSFAIAAAIRTLSPSGIEDVREALTKAGEEGFFDRVRECVKEYAEDGFWNTCSGCHESEDGYDVGHYPFSESFNCKLGGGCSECGGIGAIWDTTDYDAMAREMLACDATESASSKIGGGNG